MRRTLAQQFQTIYRRPNPLQLLLHVGKTTRLAEALLNDPRVSILRKLMFISAICLMIITLLAGDAASELVSNILPLIGPVLGIPADASLDWVAVAVAAYNLLRIFPPQIVGEHYDQLFRRAHTTVEDTIQVRHQSAI